MEIQWIQRGSGYGDGNIYSVRLSILNSRPSKKTVIFYFNNGSHEAISKAGYVDIGICGEKRIYFIESTTGRKFANVGGNRATVQVMNLGLAAFVEGHTGLYELHIDPENKLYYIDFDDQWKK